jgi:hypothetical protein
MGCALLVPLGRSEDGSQVAEVRPPFPSLLLLFYVTTPFSACLCVRTMYACVCVCVYELFWPGAVSPLAGVRDYSASMPLCSVCLCLCEMPSSMPSSVCTFCPQCSCARGDALLPTSYFIFNTQCLCLCELSSKPSSVAHSVLSPAAHVKTHCFQLPLLS